MPDGSDYKRSADVGHDEFDAQAFRDEMAPEFQ